eukprot:gb/GECG01016737.1/.p1 GENE.gb/GECG01016737.1/~~gb/GECG01016737.1/.p1  ORF type:complete len:381 (+),score=54.47 gb/GECG01016737.1/:1-1143(+)
MGACQSKVATGPLNHLVSHDPLDASIKAGHWKSFSSGSFTGSPSAYDANRHDISKEALTEYSTHSQSRRDSMSSTKQFAEQVWRQNSRESLKLILEGKGADYFRKFLKKEFNENHLDFHENVEQIKQARLRGAQIGGALDRLDIRATEVYNKFLRRGSAYEVNVPSHIYDRSITDDPLEVLESAQEEVVKMLSMDCFPRFLKSEECARMLDDLEDSTLAGTVGKAKDAAPRGKGEWLAMFKSVADLLPTCIVIADMMAAGQPIIFVNEAFTKTTLYPKAVAEGRNCRFLQGPETDAVSIDIIRNALKENKDCHVKLLNYRRNGEEFHNLLSLKPVFGLHGQCEYYIGVQYEIDSASMMVSRLLQHEQLLKMLPSKISWME